MTDTLTEGREAIQHHDWDQALQALAKVDSDKGLAPDDLLNLGDAHWWTGHPDEAVQVFERAYSGFVQQDRHVEAAEVGALLAYFAMRRLAMSVFAGWVARVERLLEDQPESRGHGWLQILYLAKTLFVDSDLDNAIVFADRAEELGRNHNSPGVQGLAMSFKGIALIQQGDWQRGIDLIDEATTIAMSEGGDLRAASDVYCNTIAACRNLADYRRAGEWTEEAERWMKANSLAGYTGICQVHRAELKRLKGSWSEAEEEARRACGELERFRLFNGLGFAHYEIGEVRRRMGDLKAAEDAFMRAYEYGHPAQPGYALLLMDRGEIEEAAESIARALGQSRANPEEVGATALLSRGRLLPAMVEISLAVNDVETAREAIEELEEISQIYPSSTWEATTLTCRGSMELHEGQPEKAVETLSKAWRLWQGIDLPYESAQARLMLARAYLAVGDHGAARLELRAARSVFKELGAATDLRAVDELLEDEVTTRDRATKTFMFTDIVTSTDLIGLIGDSAWENLLEWHDRALRQEFTRHGGEEVRHTGDGFFVAFDRPTPAIEAAVAIQRHLRDHRREHGFAPWVRIGLHLTEATRQERDYAGQGVHVAARIGDLGEREEIIVSQDLLDEAGSIPYETSPEKTVELKGVAHPVRVHTIDWR